MSGVDFSSNFVFKALYKLGGQQFPAVQPTPRREQLFYSPHMERCGGIELAAAFSAAVGPANRAGFAYVPTGSRHSNHWYQALKGKEDVNMLPLVKNVL